jgi:hypothetical protein
MANANALTSSRGRQGYNQPLIRQDEAEDLHLVSEEEDEQMDDLILLFIRTPHTLLPVDNDSFSDKEPQIRQLDDDNNLDINLINTNNTDIKPKPEGVKEPADQDLLAA